MGTARYSMIDTPEGRFPVFSPNQVTDCGEFHISYNDYDLTAYGCDTTALVLSGKLKFYILNGDHREAYQRLIPQGFQACLEYFKSKPELVNFRSNKLES